jgi:hypothetical protein
MGIRNKQMKLWKKLSLMGIGLTGAIVGGTVRRGSTNWNKKTSKLLEELQPPKALGEARTVNFKDLKGLPAPVAKYFRSVLKDGQPFVRSSRIEHAGRFNISGKENGWSSFKSTQHYSLNPPGFIWDANITMAPLINVWVRDAYVAGEGSIQAKVLSVVSVTNEHGQPELNAGSLMRYLAEAVWFPTALLPSEGVRWKPIDQHTALATLSDGDTTVSLEFRFNDANEVTGVFSHERFRDVQGKYESAAWAGYFWNYEERNGMRIPIEGEVEWQLSSGALPYWKGRVTKVEYDFIPVAH